MAKLFVSYSHKDEGYRDELEVHLAPLTQQGLMEIWHDRRIVAGDEFAGAISEQLEQADIILALVSPYSIASARFNTEMKRAMERHDRGEARVIPVILEPSEWRHAPFGKLNAVPRDGKPVAKYSNKNDAFLEVVEAVHQALAVLPSGSEASPPAAASLAAPKRSEQTIEKRAQASPDLPPKKLRVAQRSFIVLAVGAVVIWLSPSPNHQIGDEPNEISSPRSPARELPYIPRGGEPTFSPLPGRDKIKKTLEAVGDALVSYRSTSFLRLPPDSSTNWRMELLPLLGRQELYDQLSDLKPTDAELSSATAPPEYRPGGTEGRQTQVVLIGSFERAYAESYADKIMLIEVGDSGIAWTETADFTVDRAIEAIKSRNSCSDKGTYVVFGDGHVDLILPDIGDPALRDLFRAD